VKDKGKGEAKAVPAINTDRHIGRLYGKNLEEKSTFLIFSDLSFI